MITALVFLHMFLPHGGDSRGYDGLEAVVSTEAAPTPMAPVEVDVPRSDGARSGPRREVLPPGRLGRRRPRHPPERPATWIVGGFVDVGYAFNSNLPANHISRGAVLTPRVGEFTIQTVAVSLTHDATDNEPFRLELALQAGAAVDALYAGEPIPGGANGRFAGPEVWKHIGRANAGYLTRRGTEIGAGLFASPLGIGGFWSKDNWNYSASWESRAAAFYFAGVRVAQKLPRGFGIEGWLVNGFQTSADVNRAPSYIAGMTWAKPGWNVANYVYFGPDDIDLAPRAWRMLVSSQLTYTRERFGVAAVWDVGRERLTAAAGAPVALWTGGALFVRGRVLSRERAALDLAARPGAFLDRDRRLFGAQGWLLSGTATATLHVLQYLLPRVEYRYDHYVGVGGFFYRGDAVTDADPRLARSQHTVYFSLVGMFEHAFATPRRRRAD